MRGHLTLPLVGLMFVSAEAFGRLVVAPLMWLFPRRKSRFLNRFVRGLHALTIAILRLAGARLEVRGSIPSGPDVLVLMNHQSLMDIPVSVGVLEGPVPRFVARRRYGRGIPLISLLAKLLDCPLVDPGTRSRLQVEELRRAAAADSPHPLLIFPEGGRTRDGRIGRFKRGGLRAILAARRWSVYLVIADGFWKCARFQDFAANVGSVRATADVLGPFSPPEPGESPDAFIEEMRERMCLKLDEIRRTPAGVA